MPIGYFERIKLFVKEVRNYFISALLPAWFIIYHTLGNCQLKINIGCFYIVSYNRVFYCYSLPKYLISCCLVCICDPCECELMKRFCVGFDTSRLVERHWQFSFHFLILIYMEGSGDGSVYVWSVRSGKEVLKLLLLPCSLFFWISFFILHPFFFILHSSFVLLCWGLSTIY